MNRNQFPIRMIPETNTCISSGAATALSISPSGSISFTRKSSTVTGTCTMTVTVVYNNNPTAQDTATVTFTITSTPAINSYKQHQQYSLSLNRNEGLESFSNNSQTNVNVAGNSDRSSNRARKSEWLKSHRFSIQVNDMNKMKESWSELY